MNREILFRGKPDIDQEWLDEMELTLDEHMENLTSVNYKDGFVYGQVVYSGNQPYIVGEVVESTDEWITLEYWIPVKPETIGMQTEFIYESLETIYQNDIVLCEQEGQEPFISAVEWDKDGFTVSDNHGKHPLRSFDITDPFLRPQPKIRKVGNIHDNPELLEVE